MADGNGLSPSPATCDLRPRRNARRSVPRFFSGGISGARGTSRRVRAALLPLALVAGLLVWLGAVPALADFGEAGTNPSDSPRVDTPNDPDFDRCEADDEETGLDRLRQLLRGAVRRVRLQPRLGALGAGREDPLHELRPARRAGPGGEPRRRDRPDAVAECSQLAGVRADTAWKYSTGESEHDRRDPRHGHRVAGRRSCVEKVDLNGGELPSPEVDAGRDPRLGDQPCSDVRRRRQRCERRRCVQRPGLRLRLPACPGATATRRPTRSSTART